MDWAFGLLKQKVTWHPAHGLFADSAYLLLLASGTVAVSESAEHDLEGDKSRFQRMPSVDSFNQVKLKTSYLSDAKQETGDGRQAVVFATQNPGNHFWSLFCAELEVFVSAENLSLRMDWTRTVNNVQRVL